MKCLLSSSKYKLGQLLFFIAIGVGFYLLDRFSLFLDDDYLYAFVSGSDKPITSLSRILHSQSIDYMESNGRFLVHSIVQLFCGIIGVTSFRICNTLMLLLLCRLLFLLSANNKENVFFKNIVIITLLWFCLPLQGVTFLGNIAFSVNYLWTAVGIFGFILVYDKVKLSTHTINWWLCALLLAFGMIIGSLQESFSIGIAGTLFIYYCFHFKELKGQSLFLVLGFWIGTIVLVLAPGNFVRMADQQGGIIHSGPILYAMIKLSYLKDILFHIIILSVLLVTFILMFFLHRGFTKHFIKENYLYFGAILIDILFAVTIAYNGKWQMTCATLFAIVIMVKLIFQECGNWIIKHQKILVAIMLFSFVSSYIPVYCIRQDIYQKHQDLIHSAFKSTNGMAWGEYENIGHFYQNKNDFVNNYIRVVYYMGDNYHKELLSKYLTKGENKELVTCVLPFSPNMIESFCSTKNQLISKENIYKAGNNPFIILRAESPMALQNNILQICNTETFLKKFVKKENQQIVLKGLGCENFQYHGMYYVIVYNPLFFGKKDK